MNNIDRFTVITGGPGSGKTTLIEALAAMGCQTMPEGGRAIIQDQVAIDGQALPWADQYAFAELILSWEMRSHREAMALDGPVIFDRGVPDTIGFLRVNDLLVPPHMDKAAQLCRYARQVFVAPWWPDIFDQDAERKQSADEAERTFEIMVDTYAAYGYEPLILPLAPVEERARFVIGHLR